LFQGLSWQPAEIGTRVGNREISHRVVPVMARFHGAGHPSVPRGTTGLRVPPRVQAPPNVVPPRQVINRTRDGSRNELVQGHKPERAQSPCPDSHQGARRSWRSFHVEHRPTELLVTRHSRPATERCPSMGNCFRGRPAGYPGWRPDPTRAPVADGVPGNPGRNQG
jgi:hypothetical protein